MSGLFIDTTTTTPKTTCKSTRTFRTVKLTTPLTKVLFARLKRHLRPPSIYSWMASKLGRCLIVKPKRFSGLVFAIFWRAGLCLCCLQDAACPSLRSMYLRRHSLVHPLLSPTLDVPFLACSGLRGLRTPSAQDAIASS